MDGIRGGMEALHGAHRLDSGPRSAGPRGSLQPGVASSSFQGVLQNLTQVATGGAPSPLAPLTGTPIAGLPFAIGPNSMALDPGVATSLLTPQQQANREVGAQLEGVFASQLIKEMRQTLDGATLFGNNGGDVYGGLLDMYLSQHLAPTGFLGIGSMVEKQLNRKLV